MAALRGDTLAALRATYATSSSSSSVVGGGGKASAAAAAASMVEVDRGRCVSFAWIGTDDAYTILSPSYRCEAAKPEAKDESSSTSSSVGYGHRTSGGGGGGSREAVGAILSRSAEIDSYRHPSTSLTLSKTLTFTTSN